MSKKKGFQHLSVQNYICCNEHTRVLWEVIKELIVKLIF